jgi:hypothetical protein
VLCSHQLSSVKTSTTGTLNLFLISPISIIYKHSFSKMRFTVPIFALLTTLAIAAPAAEPGKKPGELYRREDVEDGEISATACRGDIPWKKRQACSKALKREADILTREAEALDVAIPAPEKREEEETVDATACRGGIPWKKRQACSKAKREEEETVDATACRGGIPWKKRQACSKALKREAEILTREAEAAAAPMEEKRDDEETVDATACRGGIPWRKRQACSKQ